MNIYAGAFLIPVGVMLYTAHGGLKATYIAAWGHVAVIYIALVIFAFLIYASPNSNGETRRHRCWQQGGAVLTSGCNTLEASVDCHATSKSRTLWQAC